MSYTDFDFPHSRFFDDDLRELIRMYKEFGETLEAFVSANKIKFADPIIWNITTQYSIGTIVLDITGNAYLSKQPVPAGIELNNENYWQEIFNFTNYTRTANRNLTINTETNTTRATGAYRVDDWLIWNDVLYKVTKSIAIDDTFIIAPASGANIIHFTVENFIKAFMTWATNTINQYKTEIDASELEYKNYIDASELAYRQQLAQDIASTTASLQAQLNVAIAGATVDSEVINARIGWDNTTYSTLGEAIRTQAKNNYNWIIESIAYLHGDAITNYFSGTDHVTNSSTDTRANLALQIIEYNGSNQVSVRKVTQITRTGLWLIPFTTTPASAPFDKIRLRHTGSQHDITLLDFPLSENSKDFVLVIIVNNYIPSVVGGINLEGIKCFADITNMIELSDKIDSVNTNINNESERTNQLFNGLMGVNYDIVPITPTFFTNAATDTRDHLFIFAQEYLNGSPSGSVRKQVHIQRTGLFTIEIETTSSAFLFDEIKIYHNGASQNIDIATINYNKNSTKLILTFYVDSYDPTTTNGIVLRDIKCFQIPISLNDLKDVLSRINTLENDNKYKFVNSDPIYATAHDHTNALFGELIDLNAATINIVGDSMVGNQIINKQQDPSFVTISDYIHRKYPNTTIYLWGEGGSTLAVNPNSASPNESIYERIAGIAPYQPVTREADVWVIWGGYNDILMNVETPLGDNGSTDTSTLYGVMREIVYNIQDRVNCPRVILVTPHYAYGIQRYQTGGIDRLHNLRECFYEIGDELSCIVCDLFKKSGLNNRNGIFTHTDGLHLNQNGYYYVYPLIMKAIEECFN